MGGAMFGVVPNYLEQNQSSRCQQPHWYSTLFINWRWQLILIDTGMGNKQSEKFYGYYSLWGTHLDNSLAKYGFHRDDITDVFMTFAFWPLRRKYTMEQRQKVMNQPLKNAKFWTNENHWEWATKPNVRESFVLVLKISYPCRKVANCIL
jgi:hypothetical protein